MAENLFVCYSCGEARCGRIIVAPESSSDVELKVAPSGIEGAGLGLFTCKKIKPNTEIGVFGGRVMCVECVKKQKLYCGRATFTTVQCDVTYNCNGDPILWHVCRTFDVETDGVVWFINSCHRQNRFKRHRKPNCCIEFIGFDADEDPITLVTSMRAIEAGTELLLRYMQ